jgi:hypothetical protein
MDSMLPVRLALENLCEKEASDINRNVINNRVSTTVLDCVSTKSLLCKTRNYESSFKQKGSNSHNKFFGSNIKSAYACKQLISNRSSPPCCFFSYAVRHSHPNVFENSSVTSFQHFHTRCKLSFTFLGDRMVVNRRAEIHILLLQQFSNTALHSSLLRDFEALKNSGT